MKVLKDFILRENTMKYTAGDNFPRESVASFRVAELVAKGYLQGEDEAQIEVKQEEAEEADKPAKTAKKKTSTSRRAKKG